MARMFCAVWAFGLLAVGARAQTVPSNGLPLRIGADQVGANRFVGEIAAVRLYSRALSPAEIGRLAAGKPTGFVRLAGLAMQAVFGAETARSPRASGSPAAVGDVPIVEVGGVRAARMGGGFLEAAPSIRLSPTREMTIEAWVRPGDLPPSGGRIVDKITGGGSDGWLLDTYPGRSLRLIVGSSTLASPVSLPYGQWAHVAATVAPDGALAIFLDGNRVAGGAAEVSGEPGVVFAGCAPAPPDALTLWYRRPAGRWVEALPLGNGRIGGMVYGGVVRERVALNEDTLWSGEPTDTLPKEGRAALPEVRRLLLAGQNRKAHDLVAAKMLGPFFQTYLPLGELSLDLGDVSEVSDYRRDLGLSTGVARVRYRTGGATYTRETFISFPAQALVMRLTSDAPDGLSFVARLSTQLHGSTRSDRGDLLLEGRCPYFADAYGSGALKYDDAPNGKGMRFAVRLRACVEGGAVQSGDDGLTIDGARAVTLILTARTSYNGFAKSPSADGKDAVGDCTHDMDAVAARPYAKLLAEHAADFRSLSGRVALDLGRGPNAKLPTDARVRSYTASRDPGLPALYFQFGRYLLISGSRPGTQPLNLQGIWNDRLIAPWASNWTLNCNAEINYWPVEVANLSECHLPLVEMAREISVDGARVARELYAAEGWMTHHNADIWRRATPVAGDPVWAIFQVGGAWLCQHAWEHYAFTGDREYLRSIWPLLREAARYFLTSMVVEPKHGWLVDAPATNFESYFRKPDGETAAVCMGPTADMQMIRELFQNCVAASRELGTDAELRAELERALPRLAPMQVSPRTGELQEWLDDWDHANPGNGQVLSTWGLVCGTQITPRGAPELARALRKSIDDRKPWNTWVGSWTGAFMSNAFARLGDGDMALMVLDKHLARVLNPNLTASFEGMAEWEIDGNLGQTAAIAEMLLQSHTGEIELLPALPKAWASGAVRGLRARGGFELDLAWKGGKLASAVVRSVWGRGCTLRYRGKTVRLSLQPGAVARLDGELQSRK